MIARTIAMYLMSDPPVLSEVMMTILGYSHEATNTFPACTICQQESSRENHVCQGCGRCDNCHNTAPTEQGESIVRDNYALVVAKLVMMMASLGILELDDESSHDREILEVATSIILGGHEREAQTRLMDLIELSDNDLLDYDNENHSVSVNRPGIADKINKIDFG